MSLPFICLDHYIHCGIPNLADVESFNSEILRVQNWILVKRMMLDPTGSEPLTEDQCRRIDILRMRQPPSHNLIFTY